MVGIPTTLVFLIAVHLFRNAGTVVPEGRIIGGEEAIPNEFPHVVLILVFNNGSFEMCGGSILTPEYILTAAHCVKDVPIRTIKIFAGRHDLRVRDDPAKPLTQRAVVDSVFVHECYKGPEDVDLVKRRRNDIALIKLDKCLKYTRTVMPIQVDDKGRAIPHTGVTIVGWGVTNPNPNVASSSSVLKKGNLNISEEGECEESFLFFHKDSQICAFSSDVFACQGDSGGSLICQEGDTRYVCGIVSFGDSRCVNYSSVYTRVEYFKDWIGDIIKNGRQSSLDCDNLNPSTTPSTAEESTTKCRTVNVGKSQRPLNGLYYGVIYLFSRF